MAILSAFDFTAEHLYEFCMDNKMYSEDCYRFNPMEDDLFDEDDAEGTDIALDELGLIEGQKFSLHYDFGDDWQLLITVEQELEGVEHYPVVVEFCGNNLIEDCGGIERYQEIILSRDDLDINFDLEDINSCLSL